MEVSSKNSVRLISKTEGAKGTEYEGRSLDEIIVGVARVSSCREVLELFDSPEKLLRYCIRNQHWSVLESASLTFEIITSRAVSHEIVRHKSMNFQEFCMCGSTKVLMADKSTKTLEYLFKNKPKGGLYVKVFDFDRKTFFNAPIKEVFSTGKKDIYEFTFTNGKKIRSTKDHKVLTRSGKYFPMSKFFDINNLDCIDTFTEVYMNNYNYTDIANLCNVDHIGIGKTYDLEIDHPTHHNYVANGVVVHNSLRYADALSIQEVELREAGSTNRQSSEKPIPAEDPRALAKDMIIKDTASLYADLTAKEGGIAKETARFILPLATTTKLNMTGNIRSIVTFLNARLHKTAQAEIRDVAERIRDIFILECPIISKCFFNFEGAKEMHILERIVLDRHKALLNKP